VLRPRAFPPRRTLAVVWIAALATAYVVSVLKCPEASSNLGVSFPPSLMELQAFAIDIVVFVIAPAFLIYRAMTAPLTSGVFAIIYIASAAATYFIVQCGFPDISCLRTDVRRFDCFFGVLCTSAGAFLCLFPKWKGES
jgi:hypothetical protein